MEHTFNFIESNSDFYLEDYQFHFRPGNSFGMLIYVPDSNILYLSGDRSLNDFLPEDEWVKAIKFKQEVEHLMKKGSEIFVINSN